MEKWAASVTVKRNPEHNARTAKILLRFATLEILVPVYHIARSQFLTVKLQLIIALEENPPSGIEAIKWLLYSTVRCMRLRRRYVRDSISTSG